MAASNSNEPLPHMGSISVNPSSSSPGVELRKLSHASFQPAASSSPAAMDSFMAALHGHVDNVRNEHVIIQIIHKLKPGPQYYFTLRTSFVNGPSCTIPSSVQAPRRGETPIQCHVSCVSGRVENGHQWNIGIVQIDIGTFAIIS